MRRRFLASVLATLPATACSIDPEARGEPAWLPLEAIEGRFRPEVNQADVPAAPGARLRVVTFNTWLGIDVDALAPHLVARPELAAAELLLLQETDDYAAAGASDAARLAAELGMGHVFVPTEEPDGGTRGLSILSRYALRELEVMYLSEAHEIDIATSARAAVAATVDTAAGPLRVVNVHLDVPLNIPERVLQLRPVVLEAPSPIVVAGDLNTNDYVWAGDAVPLLPIDAVADTAQAAAIDAYVRALGYDTPTAGFGPTWDGPIEDQRLDSIFTRGVVPGQGGVEREVDVSDHWPVWLDVEVR